MSCGIKLEIGNSYEKDSDHGSVLLIMIDERFKEKIVSLFKYEKMKE